MDDLPPKIAAYIRAQNADAQVLAEAESDLCSNGQFGREHVVVTRDFLYVFTADASEPRTAVGLATASESAVLDCVGGGALIITADGVRHELIRFTAALRPRFAALNQFLTAVIKHQQLPADSKEPFPEFDDKSDGQKQCPKCQLILPPDLDLCPACVNKAKVIGRLWTYLRPYKWTLFFVWLMLLAGTGMSLIPPYLHVPLMDKVLAPRAGDVAMDTRVKWLGLIVLGFLVVTVSELLINIVRGRLVVGIGKRISRDLRDELYRRIHAQSLSYFNKHQTGTVIARVTQDTQSLESVITDGAEHLLVQVLTLTGIGCILFTINWKLTLLILIPAPFVYLFSHFFWERVKTLWRRAWHYRSRLSAVVNDSISGVRVVKAFAQEGQELARFDRRSNELFEAGMKAETMWVTFFPALGFLIGIGSLIGWYVGGRDVLQGEMTVGELVAFAAYMAMFFGPLRYFSNISNWLARGLAASERVFEVMDAIVDVRDAEDIEPQPAIKGHVELRDVSFGYDDKPVLKNLSLDVQAGEMIGLVGQSGAGKSTTINVICRLYDVDDGAILIDGTDVRDFAQDDLRSQIGVVLQDTFLFNGTIAENIAYPKPEADLMRIMAAAKAANAHDFIVNRPHGYDTVVGERGQLLSGGERQRLAIARAILHDPKILILDEATSSVDTDTEQQIQEALSRLIKGRTTFAIAHRLSTLRNADRLVVLKGGEIAEMGTHEELLAKEGEFHRLVTIQSEMSKIVEVS